MCASDRQEAGPRVQGGGVAQQADVKGKDVRGASPGVREEGAEGVPGPFGVSRREVGGAGVGPFGAEYVATGVGPFGVNYTPGGSHRLAGPFGLERRECSVSDEGTSDLFASRSESVESSSDSEGRGNDSEGSGSEAVGRMSVDAGGENPPAAEAPDRKRRRLSPSTATPRIRLKFFCSDKPVREDRAGKRKGKVREKGANTPGRHLHASVPTVVRNQEQRKRKRCSTDFDLDNVVMSCSLGGGTPVSRPPRREISTPQWRLLSDMVGMVSPGPGTVTVRVLPGGTVSNPPAGKREEEEEELEDISDEVYLRRHRPFEVQERVRAGLPVDENFWDRDDRSRMGRHGTVRKSAPAAQTAHIPEWKRRELEAQDQFLVRTQEPPDSKESLKQRFIAIRSAFVSSKAAKRDGLLQSKNWELVRRPEAPTIVCFRVKVTSKS
mmetsp:Transcript_32936/g.92235  ORF Transcript_32936/g.92235 Transcript_32936/m.92235 type:complete len:438 (+) Transcript_32936:107-1420(+)